MEIDTIDDLVAWARRVHAGDAELVDRLKAAGFDNVFIDKLKDFSARYLTTEATNTAAASSRGGGGDGSGTKTRRVPIDASSLAPTVD